MLTPLLDSGELLRAGDFAALHANLARDGYLYLKGALPEADVTAARERVLRHLEEKGDVLEIDAARPRSDGVLRERCGHGCIPFMEGRNDVTHSAELLNVFEGDAINRIFRGLLQCDDVRSFDFKWLRGMPRDGFTGAHVDRVYMGRGSESLMTCWVPFGDNPIELGALAVCSGSHRLESFAKLRATYGAMDHESDRLDGSGWFSEDPAEVLALCPGGEWKTADFGPGDIVTFGMQTIHMSTSNTTDRVRISADIRWQNAADPIDPRYVGEFIAHKAKAGAWAAEDDESKEEQRAAGAAPKVTIRELRERWGFPLPDGVDMK
jgi:hypothetical protein